MKIRRFMQGSMLLVAFFAGLVMNVAFGDTANAWCDSYSPPADQEEICIAENFDDIRDNGSDRQLTLDQFNERIQTCIDGEAGGVDDETRATCSNAIVYCYDHAIDPKACENGNDLATIANGECNLGRGTNDTDDYCLRMYNMNKAATDKMKEDAIKAAEAGCMRGGAPGSAEAALKLQECRRAINESNCVSPVGTIGSYDHTSTAQELNANAYQDCLTNALRDGAQNPEECKARGGFWQTSPGGSGTSATPTTDCKPKLEEIENKQSCEANGGQWVGGLDGAQAPRCAPKPPPPPEDPCQGKTGAELEGCRAAQNPQTDCDTLEDPTARAACVAEQGEQNGDAEGPSQTIDRVQTQCGEARVNLLVCSEQRKGGAALSDILRMALIVVSISVGVAAVGGIAWAATLYAKAGDNEGNVSEAKTLIQNVVIGIILYVFLAAIALWLIPTSS